MRLVSQFTTDPGSNTRKCDIWNEILHTGGVQEELQKGKGVCVQSKAML